MIRAGQVRSGQVRSIPPPIGSPERREERFSRDPLPVFSAVCEQFWHGQGCPHFDVVHAAFPQPTTALPTLQIALKDGFGGAVEVTTALSPVVIQTFTEEFLSLLEHDLCV